MTRMNVVLLGVLFAVVSSRDAAAGRQNSAAAMNVIVSSLSELEPMQVDAPKRARIGERFHLTLFASIPDSVTKKLSDAGFNLADEVRPGHETELGPFLPGTIKSASDGPLGVDVGKCIFGFRQNSTKYEVFWRVAANPTQKGEYEARFYFYDPSDIDSEMTIRVVDDVATSAMRMLTDLETPSVPALLWLAFAVTLIASDMWLILAAGALGVGLCSRFGIGWTVLAATISIIVLVLNHLRGTSFVRAVLAKFIAEPATSPDNASGIDQLHGRAEKMASDAMRRAHWALGAGIVAAVAAAVVLLPLYGVVADLADADADSSLIKLVGAALPWLLLFVSLMIGTRWFLTQYRQSLDDHRHFDEKLRDRELVRFVLSSDQGLNDELKKLLLNRVVSEATVTSD